MIYQVKNKQFLDYQTVQQITGMSKSTIHKLLKETKKIKYGNKFLFETNSLFNSIMNNSNKSNLNHIKGFNEYSNSDLEELKNVEKDQIDLDEEEIQIEPEEIEEKDQDEKPEDKELDSKSIEDEFNEMYNSSDKKRIQKKINELIGKLNTERDFKKRNYIQIEIRIERIKLELEKLKENKRKNKTLLNEV